MHLAFAAAAPLHLLARVPNLFTFNMFDFDLGGRFTLDPSIIVLDGGLQVYFNCFLT